MADPCLTDDVLRAYRADYKLALHDYRVAHARATWQRGYVEELSRIPTRLPKAGSQVRVELARREAALVEARKELLTVIGLLRGAGLMATAPWEEEVAA